MDIPVSSDALDVDFHPSSSKRLLATGLISGKVQLIDFSKLDAEANEGAVPLTSIKGKEKQYVKRWTVRPSGKSCRAVAFSKDDDGDSLFSLTKDGSIHRLDTETGNVVSTWGNAHQAAPSRIVPIEKNLLATGDDDGVVSFWDPRVASSSSSSESAPVRSYAHHFDWITSMLWCTHLAPPKKAKLSKEEEEKKRLQEEKKRKRKEKRSGGRDLHHDDEAEDNNETRAHRERLVVTSGDGTLSVIDVRAGKSGVEVSEDQEDELLSIAPVKRESKLVVGTQLGILSLWAPTKGLLDHVDRIPGHPSSVDAMCTLDNDTVLTGSSDGLVRVVQILPHKLLGIIADHGGMPVERLARRDNWMASIGHGPEIKLTDLSPLFEEDEDEEETEGGEGRDLPSLGIMNLSSAVDEEDSSEDENEDENAEEELEAYSQDEKEVREGREKEDESDSEPERKVERPTKKARGATLLLPVTGKNDETTSDFFADL